MWTLKLRVIGSSLGENVDCFEVKTISITTCSNQGKQKNICESTTNRPLKQMGYRLHRMPLLSAKNRKLRL